MVVSEKVESKLHEILKSGEPKSIKLVDPNTGELKKIYLSKKIIKDVNEKIEQLPETETSGGFLPLAALLPLIFSGITAAGATAGAIANTVKNAKVAKQSEAEARRADAVAKQSEAEARLADAKRTEVESNIKKGSAGIYLNPNVGNGMIDFLKQQTKISNNKGLMTKEFKNIFKNLKAQAKSGNGFQILKQGDGIFLTSASTPSSMQSPLKIQL